MYLDRLPNQPLDSVFDANSFETVEETPVSYITKAVYRADAQRRGPWLAIKTVSVRQEWSKEPHDAIKESKLLACISHPNIIELLGCIYEPASACLHFWMPFLDYRLSDLLNSASFSPYPREELLPPGVPAPSPAAFAAVAKSLIYQVTAAVAYLHGTGVRIAHRDVKPGNVLLSASGCAKLIDFGIAWNEAVAAGADVLWPECPSRMCAHVCTGPYRAPETIFGPRTYNPFAVDLWSLGALCAEFFSSLRWTADGDEEDEMDMGGGDTAAPPPPHRTAPAYEQGAHGMWVRDALFDASRGSIGLAWSIFVVRGSPTAANWPTFQDLPDANKVNFVDVSPVDLRSRLPNLPEMLDSPPWTGDHFPPRDMSSSPLDLIHRLLVYPPERRLQASSALQHPWFTDGPLYLPPECATADRPGAPDDLLQRALFSPSGYMFRLL